MREFGRICPDDHVFVDSTAAARLNGYLGGYGGFAQLQSEVGSLGLSGEGEQRLLEIVRRLGRSAGLTC
jgi:peptide-methionine (S)-S-oxide reductase